MTGTTGPSYTADGNKLYAYMVTMANTVAAYLQAGTGWTIILPARLSSQEATKTAKPLLVQQYPGKLISPTPLRQQVNWPLFPAGDITATPGYPVFPPQIPSDIPQQMASFPVQPRITIPIDLTFGPSSSTRSSPRRSSTSRPVSQSPVGSARTPSMAALPQQPVPLPPQSLPISTAAAAAAAGAWENPDSTSREQLMSVESKLDKVLENQMIMLRHSERLLDINVIRQASPQNALQVIQSSDLVTSLSTSLSQAAPTISLPRPEALIREEHVFDEYQEQVKLKRKAKDLEWESQNGN